MEKTSENNINVVNLRETELRLGLPGSVSPERKAKNGVPLFGKVLEESRLNKFASGAKRGFCDATNASDKWGFVGSEVLKTCVVESDNNNNLKSCLGGFLVKESSLCSTSLRHVEEKKKSSPLNESASKAQVVGWPPIKSFRKNTLATNVSKNADVVEGTTTSSCIYVKVSMDGAPYLRKVDLRTYCNYPELSSALESMFSCFTIGQCTSEREPLTVNRLMDLVHGSEYVLTYEDKDGDWMLVGDVPWNMFTNSCKRLRIMRGSEAVGLAPRAMEKCKSQH